MGDNPGMTDRALREHILDAAEACLLDNGALGRIHGSIAARAGVSRPTVYKYVGDQDEIIGALLLREADRFLRMLAPLIESCDSLREWLEEFVVVSVGHIRDSPLFTRLLSDQPQFLLPWLTTHAEPNLRGALSSMAPQLAHEHPGPGEAQVAIVVEWAIRLAVSLVTTPSSLTSLATEEDLRRHLKVLLDIPGRYRD